MGKVCIPQEAVFKAVAKNNCFRGRQKVYDWAWASYDDDICFYTTSSEEPTEHYSPKGLCSAMREYFAEIDPLADKVEWFGGSFIFFKEEGE